MPSTSLFLKYVHVVCTYVHVYAHSTTTWVMICTIGLTVQLVVYVTVHHAIDFQIVMGYIKHMA